MNTHFAPADTAQLFRSVRAARAWVQAGIAKPDRSPVAGCVTMKPGAGGPPVFMIPGAAGSILQIAPLASALTVPAPVYAVKPRGLEPDEAPCDTLAEMAEHAIGVMTTVQPQGPLLLIGYSAGGLVALEAARRLEAAGREVPLVVLLDTYPSRATWPFGCHVEILVRQAFRALGTLRRLPLREVVDDAARRLRSLLLYLTSSGFKVITPSPLVAEGSDPRSRRVHRATYNAGEAYRPLPYGGRVVFIQPEFVPNLEPREPRRVWGQFLSDLTIRRVPGSHLAMLDECAASAAAEITRCLAQARRW